MVTPLATDEPSAEPDTGAEPRWLDDDDQITWRTFYLTVRLLVENFERDLQRETGLPLSYYEILVQLSEAPDRTMRMSELAAASHVSRSALSHAVSRLESNGWIVREDCPTDRRGALAILTDDGFATLTAAAPAHVESVRHHLFDQLAPEELDQLRGLSERLLVHFRAEGLVPAVHAADPDRYKRKAAEKKRREAGAAEPAST